MSYIFVQSRPCKQCASFVQCLRYSEYRHNIACSELIGNYEFKDYRCPFLDPLVGSGFQRTNDLNLI